MVLLVLPPGPPSLSPFRALDYVSIRVLSLSTMRIHIDSFFCFCFYFNLTFKAISASSGYTAIALTIVAVATVVAKHLWIKPKYHYLIPNWNAIGLAFVVPQVYYPIAMCVSLPFPLSLPPPLLSRLHRHYYSRPLTTFVFLLLIGIGIGICRAFGATANFIWARRSPKSFDMYMFPIAAGLMAGEGLGGVVGAILAVANVDGSSESSHIVPQDSSCALANGLFSRTVYGTVVGCPDFAFCG